MPIKNDKNSKNLPADTFSLVLNFLNPQEISYAQQGFGKDLCEEKPTNENLESQFLADIEENILSPIEIRTKYSLTQRAYSLLTMEVEEYKPGKFKSHGIGSFTMYNPVHIGNKHPGLNLLRHGIVTLSACNNISHFEYDRYKDWIEKSVYWNTPNIRAALQEKLLDLDITWNQYPWQIWAHLSTDNALQALRTTFRNPIDENGVQHSKLKSRWTTLLAYLARHNSAWSSKTTFLLFSDRGLKMMQRGQVTEEHILFLEDYQLWWLIHDSWKIFGNKSLSVEQIKQEIAHYDEYKWHFSQNRIALGLTTLFWELSWRFLTNNFLNVLSDKTFELFRKIYDRIDKLPLILDIICRISVSLILGAVTFVPLAAIILSSYIAIRTVGYVLAAVVSIFEYPLRAVLGKDSCFYPHKKKLEKATPPAEQKPSSLEEKLIVREREEKHNTLQQMSSASIQHDYPEIISSPSP